MRNIYSIVAIGLITLLVIACQEENTTTNVGYLRLEVGTTTYVNPRTRVAEDYNPKQIAIQIVNANNEVVEKTDDWETWAGTQLSLDPGTYTIYASSNGFDGSESGFDTPYYTGSQEVTIETAKEVTASITCTLANVKVTVNFDDDFKEAFTSATATVTSAVEGVNALDFVMGTTTSSGYFPVGDLNATVSVINQSGETHSLSKDITGVSARDHYILNYKVAKTGTGAVTVSVDESEITYTFTFSVSTVASTTLAVSAADAWATFAYVTGSIESSEGTLEDSNMKFQYQVAGNDNTWATANVISATATGDGTYKATLTGLTASTKYEYRMFYDGEEEDFASLSRDFTTEDATELVNGNMDDWYQSGNTWYPISETYYTTNGGSFWDTSNPGTTTGAGSMINVNPTQGNSSTVHTAGGKSAELQSQYAGVNLGFTTFGKFAAASLYTGSFGELVGTSGAKINFGQPFTARPTQLHGWFRYTTGTMDYVGNTPEELGIVQGTTTDVCSIYIALATKTYTIDNTDTSTFIDYDTDEGIIAYGELPLSESVSTNGSWKEFTIDLEYKDLTTKPSYIIIVCSSSRYGDYFTGSTSSLMYIDDMELLYSKEPTVKE